MRDLYERLGLGFGAEEPALRKAVAQSTDGELVRRVEGVLLDPARRAAHDRVYLVARRLRDWREELLLEDGPWAQALADSDLVRPDLPVEPLPAAVRVAATSATPWWRRLFGG